MQEFSWNVRNYEMSVWTLQDSYLTTLKSADGPYDPLESKRMTWPRTRYRGQVQNGEMVINMDGTRTLKFDIPMYIEEKGQKIENPNWYTVQDKNILTAMRKIKVIFDKMIDKGDEFSKTKDTFEFIILKVEETHEHDNCTCHVECEGLAFHELGKVGYTIALSKDDYNNDYYDWDRKKLSEFDGNTDEEREANRAALKPINNIDYWLGKAGIEKCPLKENSYDIDLNEMNSTKWYYKVEMSQSGYAGAIQLNPDKIYTEAAITDWDNNGNAVSYEGVKEMLRLVDIKESNLYNITQDLAETFGVFCRYDYYYDDNYGIDGKCIVFYNNYLKEDEGMVSFLYPDNAQKISRSMDSTDITTKMFVRNVVSDSVYNGLISIVDTGINKSKEDYLLNFDYLHQIKTISDEQYEAIKQYELDMREANQNIVPIQEGLNYLRDIKTQLEAKISILTNSLTLDAERITETSALRNALDEADGDADGYITIDYTNPDTFFLLKNSSGKRYDTYYVQLNQNGKYGVDISSLEMYETYHMTSNIASKYCAFTDKLVRSSTNKVRQNIINQLEGSDGVFNDNSKIIITDAEGKKIVPTYIGTYTEPTALKAIIGYLYKYTGTYKYEVKGKKDANATAVTSYGKYSTSEAAESAKATAEKAGWLEVVVSDYVYKINDKTVGTNDLILCTAENTWKKIDNSGDGIYLWNCTVVDQLNGVSHKLYEATFFEGKNAMRKHMNYVRYLYYATNSNEATPAIKAEEVIESDEHNKWTSYIPTLDDSDHLYRALEFHFSNGDKHYWKEGTGLGEITNSTPEGYSNKTYYQAQQENKGSVLEDKVTGHIEYDESGNPSKITNIYKVKKNGSYYSYHIMSNSQVTTNTDYNNENNNGLTLPSTQDKTKHINYANKIKSTVEKIAENAYVKNIPLSNLTDNNLYILVRDQHYYVEADKSYNNYTLKYYDITYGTGIESTSFPSNCVVTITPMFRLTDGTAPAQPTPDDYSNWSSYAPTRKKDAQKVYVCYQIVDFNNNIYFTTAVEDSTYKVRKTPVSTNNKTIPKYLYATYKYNPTLYYDQIKDSWIRKEAQDKKNLEECTNRRDLINEKITKYETELNKYLAAKKKTIDKFNRMMGPALRESYWQPDEDYQDNGTFHNDTLTLPEFNDTTVPAAFRKDEYGFFYKPQGSYSSYGYDGMLSEDETKNYYYYGVEKKKKYYPCIDISKLGRNAENKTFEETYKEQMQKDDVIPFSVIFNPSNEVKSEDDSDYDMRYCKYYTLGSQAELVFLYNKTDNNVKPVIMLTGADELSNSELKNLEKTWWIGQVSVDDPVTSASESQTTIELDYDTNTYFKHVTTQNANNNPWMSNDILKKCFIVYPRIKIPSLKLKTGEEDIILKLNYTENNETKDVALKRYGDYRLLVKSYKRVNTPDNALKIYRSIEEINNNKINPATLSTAYTITIKPEILLKYGVDSTVKITYALSNADSDIYVDARKILKENAYPKVSYDIDTIFWKSDFNNELYRKLAQIIMINDVELKFDNVFGYISEITIDLDHQNNDKIEVKNYKTKFEDLFSKIVAQTEEMHKNAHNIGLAGGLQAGAGTGINVPISAGAFEKTIEDCSETLTKFIDEYFDGRSVVENQIKELWNEAGAILGSAAQSLNNVMGLTTQNASILAGFRENVAAALTPTVFEGPEPPATFKAGDVWKNGENFTAVAVSPYGFTRTYDGTIGEITSPYIKIHTDNDDPDIGKIDIVGKTQINLTSGQNIYMRANDDISIVGNNTVNIGGSTINMASVYRDNDGNEVDADDDESSASEGLGGIHLLASYIKWDPAKSTYVYDAGATSKVDVTGEGITLASKNGIIIKSGAGIDIKSSDDTNVSAVQIDKDKGIFIGSNNAIKLYTGTAAEYFYGPYHGAKFHKGDYWYKTSVVNGKTNLNRNMEQVSQVENYYYINRSNNDANATYYVAEKDWTEVYDTLNNAKAATANLDGWILCEKPEINGASVDLGPDHLLLGVANVGKDTATAISMTDEEIILAAGNQISKMTVMDGKVTDFSNSSIAGLQIQKDYIGMAVNGTYTRSLLSLNPTKVLLGTVTKNVNYEVLDYGATWNTNERNTAKIYLIPEDENGDYYTKYQYVNNTWSSTAHVGPELYSGSYLWLGKEEIYIGSMGHLTLNTNNIKLSSKLLQSPELNSYSSDNTSYVYVMLTAGTIWNATGKDTHKIYLIPTSNKYTKYYYSIAEKKWNNTVISSLPQDYKPVATSLADSQDARKMGFALGTHLQSEQAEQSVGMAYWLDKSQNSHFLVQSSGAFFSITNNEFGIFKRHPNNNGGYDAATGLLWFDGTDLWLKGTLHVGGGVDGTKIYTTDDSGAGVTTDWDTYWASQNIEYFTKLQADADQLVTDAEAFAFSAFLGVQLVQGSIGEAYTKLSSFVNNTLNQSTITFAARAINMYASTGDMSGTSAISIDPQEGIFIGSGKRVLIGATTNVTYGSIIDLVPDRILIGVSSTNTVANSTAVKLLQGTSVVELTSGEMVIAVAEQAGVTVDSLHTATIDSLTGISGAQIQKDYIGLFARSGANVGGISIRPNQILLGTVETATGNNKGVFSGTFKITPHEILMGVLENTDSARKTAEDNNNGAYLAITKDSFIMGSSGTFEINSPNCRINSNASGSQYSLFIQNTKTAMRFSPQDNFEILKRNANDTYTQLLWLTNAGDLRIAGHIVSQDSFVDEEPWNDYMAGISTTYVSDLNALRDNMEQLVADAASFTIDAFSGARDLRNTVITGYSQLQTFIQNTSNLDDIIFGGKTIKMYTSRGNAQGTNAFVLDPDQGVFIGSGKRVLISSTISENTGAAIDITPTRILFGATTTDATAENPVSTTITSNNSFGDITSDQVLFASVSTDKDIEDIEDTTIDSLTGVSGVQIKKDFVGLYARSGNNTGGISIRPNKVLLGTINEQGAFGSTLSIEPEKILLGTTVADENAGTYVSITKSEFKVGSNGTVKILTPRFRINSTASDGESGGILYIANDATWSDATGGIRFYVNSSHVAKLQIKGELQAATGTFKGELQAATGSFTGSVTATSFVLQGNNDYIQEKYWRINTRSTAYTESNAPSSGWTLWSTEAPNLTDNKGNYLHTKTIVTLGGKSVATYDVQYISKDGLNGEGAVAINGLSNIFWGAAGDKKQYVAISSQGGLIMAANKDIIIPRKTPKALNSDSSDDDESDNLDTLVKINKDGINFDVYSNSTATSASAYVHMSSNGINIKGAHVYINGEQEWSRDDIIVMNKNKTNNDNDGWRRSVESIEAYMKNGSVRLNNSGKVVSSGGTLFTRPSGAATGDWVLIRPFYDALINYGYGNNYYGGSNSAIVELVQSGSTQLSFGDGATNYKYTISGDIAKGVQSSVGMRMDFSLSNSNTLEQSFTITFTGSKDTTNTNALSFSFNSGNIGTNLCSEGSILYLQINTAYSCTISNIRVECTCDATTSRVPCTVYYYP